MTVAGHIGPKPGSTIEQDFWAFHRKHPEVYDTLVSLAREWRRRRPARKLGVKCLYEVARWNFAFRITDEEPKLNNNFTSYYARLIMEREPDLADLFETRALRAPEPFDGRLFSDQVAA